MLECKVFHWKQFLVIVNLSTEKFLHWLTAWDFNHTTISLKYGKNDLFIKIDKFDLFSIPRKKFPRILIPSNSFFQYV